jgi:hypothetical protein
MKRSTGRSATAGMLLEETGGAVEVHPAPVVGLHHMSCCYFCLLYSLRDYAVF